MELQGCTGDRGLELEIRAIFWSKKAKFAAIMLVTLKYRGRANEIQQKGSLQASQKIRELSWDTYFPKFKRLEIWLPDHEEDAGMVQDKVVELDGPKGHLRHD